MKATLSVQGVGGAMLTISSHLIPSAGKPREQVLELLGADNRQVVSLTWAYGAEFFGQSGVPMTLTAGGKSRQVKFVNGRLTAEDTASDEPLLFEDVDTSELAEMRKLLRTVFAPADDNPFLPTASADDDALGTISSAAQIGAAIGGGIGLLGGAAGGPVTAAEGAGIGAVAGAIVGLEIGVGVVVLQAAYALAE